MDPRWKEELFGISHVRKVGLIGSTHALDMGVG